MATKTALSFKEENGLLWPVIGDVILNFSMEHGVYFKTLGQYKCNPAVLIGCAEGSEIYAASDGIVDAITEDDLEKEVFIDTIAINICEVSESNDGWLYPEISFCGECNCDPEHGICIGFRDKKFLGIESWDWTL